MVQRLSLILVALGLVLLGGVVGLVVFFRSAPAELEVAPLDVDLQPGLPLTAPNSPVEDGPLVFDQLEMNLGAIKKPVKHRFTFTNKGARPVRIKGVTASCACMLTKTEREIYEPHEKGSITLEVDITKREPGPHRFSVTVEYEAPQLRTARASVVAYYQPDLQVVPQVVDFSVIERGTAKANFSLIDYRPEPLKLKGFRISPPALQVRLVEKPGEYLSGWKYVLAADYTDNSDQKEPEIAGTILMETSDPEHATITVPVMIRRRARLRIAPKLVKLGKDRDGKRLSGKVVIRDILGEGVEIESVSTGGLVEVSYDRKPEPTKLLTITLPQGPVDAAKFPATIQIKVKQPWTRTISVTAALSPSGRS